MIPLARPIVTRSQEEAVLRVLRSGVYILGEETLHLEEEFARYCGAVSSVAVNSGAAALQLSLLALGIGEGDEVVTVSHTFAATVSAILHVRAKPVLVDIDPHTYTMDTKALEESITDRTKAIVPVHLYGHPADMNPIGEIAEKHGLFVVEDACQAHGALYRGKPVGSIGAVGCFSFYPSKNMTVFGDGGIVVTNDVSIADKVRILRNQGQREKNVHVAVGFTMRLPEIHAALARQQLARLEGWNDARRRNAAAYNSLLEDEQQVVKPVEREWARHVYHFYVIRTRDRDTLSGYLNSRGVGVGVHYPTPVHLQPCYERAIRLDPGKLPVTETVARTVLSLPCHPSMSYEDIEFVAECVTGFMKGKE